MSDVLKAIQQVRDGEWGPMPLAAVAKLNEAAINFGKARDAEAELANEIAFNEGWQEHISDLLDAMKPFVVLVKETNGRIPTERLSFANWHSLSKAYDAAVRALNTAQCKYPLGCDCPECTRRFGPIHPGNVGKDLRSNPTGEVSNPRKA